jgi:hypothetical protein
MPKLNIWQIKFHNQLTIKDETTDVDSVVRSLLFKVNRLMQGDQIHVSIKEYVPNNNNNGSNSGPGSGSKSNPPPPKTNGERAKEWKEQIYKTKRRIKDMGDELQETKNPFRLLVLLDDPEIQYPEDEDEEDNLMTINAEVNHTRHTTTFEDVIVEAMMQNKTDELNRSSNFRPKNSNDGESQTQSDIDSESILIYREDFKMLSEMQHNEDSEECLALELLTQDYLRLAKDVAANFRLTGKETSAKHFERDVESVGVFEAIYALVRGLAKLSNFGLQERLKQRRIKDRRVRTHKAKLLKSLEDQSLY